jgi:hypothetical protein
MYCDYYYRHGLLNFVFSFINKIYLFWDVYIRIHIVDLPHCKLILAT